MNADEIKDGLVDDPKPVAPRRTGKQWCFLFLKVVLSTVAGVLIVLFILLSLYFFTRRGGHGYRSDAIMNAGQIGKTLFSFEQEYERYPNDETAKSISLSNDLGVFDLGRPGSSNYYFRQLIVTGYFDQENPFDLLFQEDKKADNVMEGSKLLESGECAYGYVVWDSTKNLHRLAPLVMTPLILGKRQFDYEIAKKYFGSKVIVLHHDTSVRAHPIDRSGRVMIDGKDFFDPSQPYWGGQKPRIAWPE